MLTTCSHLRCSVANGYAVRDWIWRHEGEDLALWSIYWTVDDMMILGGQEVFRPAHEGQC